MFACVEIGVLVNVFGKGNRYIRAFASPIV